MVALTDNNISFKEYSKEIIYKNLEIEIQKIWLHKTNTVPLILLYYQKETEKHINKIFASPSILEIKKKTNSFQNGHLLNVTEKISTKKRQQKKTT